MDEFETDKENRARAVPWNGAMLRAMGFGLSLLFSLGIVTAVFYGGRYIGRQETQPNQIDANGEVSRRNALDIAIIKTVLHQMEKEHDKWKEKGCMP